MSFPPNSNLKIAVDPSTGIHYISGHYRRTAGRPRAGEQAPVIAIFGNRYPDPMVHDATHELLLANPLVRVLNMLKTLMTQLAIINIVLQFRHDGLHIVEDTEKRGETQGRLAFHFIAPYVNYYYCSTPINIMISRDKFQQAMNVMSNETHYVLWRVRRSETPGHVQIETLVHMNSNRLAECQKTQMEFPVVGDSETKHVCEPRYHYPLEFRIQNSVFKSYIRKEGEHHVTIMKAHQTDLKIFYERDSQSCLIIPMDSGNLIYDRLCRDQILSVMMPVALAQTFSQQGDAQTQLRIAIHPIDPIVLSYHIENTQYRTQYEMTTSDKVYGAIVSLHLVPFLRAV